MDPVFINGKILSLDYENLNCNYLGQQQLTKKRTNDLIIIQVLLFT